MAMTTAEELENNTETDQELEYESDEDLNGADTTTCGQGDPTKDNSQVYDTNNEAQEHGGELELEEEEDGSLLVRSNGVFEEEEYETDEEDQITEEEEAHIVQQGEDRGEWSVEEVSDSNGEDEDEKGVESEEEGSENYDSEHSHKELEALTHIPVYLDIGEDVVKLFPPSCKEETMFEDLPLLFGTSEIIKEPLSEVFDTFKLYTSTTDDVVVFRVPSLNLAIRSDSQECLRVTLGDVLATFDVLRQQDSETYKFVQVEVGREPCLSAQLEAIRTQRKRGRDQVENTSEATMASDPKRSK